jgi:small subunit ribosomal protein S21
MEVRVDVGEGEPIDSAIARFRREVSKSGHLFELKRRQEFEPNSVKRQRKRKQALRKAKLALFRGKKLENLRKDIL